MTGLPTRRCLLVFAFVASLGLGACFSTGRDFDATPVPELRIGETTRDEILEQFGRPWRVGMEDGQRTWTYGYYRYSLFGEPRARDLVVKFDENGVLSSYTYNTTERAR